MVAAYGFATIHVIAATGWVVRITAIARGRAADLTQLIVALGTQACRTPWITTNGQTGCCRHLIAVALEGRGITAADAGALALGGKAGSVDRTVRRPLFLAAGGHCQAHRIAALGVPAAGSSGAQGVAAVARSALRTLDLASVVDFVVIVIAQAHAARLLWSVTPAFACFGVHVLAIASGPAAGQRAMAHGLFGRSRGAERHPRPREVAAAGADPGTDRLTTGGISTAGSVKPGRITAVTSGIWRTKRTVIQASGIRSLKPRPIKKIEVSVAVDVGTFTFLAERVAADLIQACDKQLIVIDVDFRFRKAVFITVT